MKKLMIAALLSGQFLTAAAPAAGAELDRDASPQMGAFGGLRVRLPLDGNVQQRQLRAGLALAPTLHSRAINGETRMRMGEGLEVGVTGRHPVRVMLAGQDVRRLGAAQQTEEEEEERGGGPSTLGWIAIGAGALILVTAVAGFIVVDDILDCDSGEVCT